MNTLIYFSTVYSENNQIILDRLGYYLDDINVFSITFENGNVVIEGINIVKEDVIKFDSAMSSLGYVRK